MEDNNANKLESGSAGVGKPGSVRNSPPKASGVEDEKLEDVQGSSLEPDSKKILVRELSNGSEIKSVIMTALDSLDGKVLIVLCICYLLLFLSPDLAVSLLGKKGFLNSISDSRLVFSMMPILLLSEYFWFSLNNGNKYLTTIILITTSLIPILNIYK